jgi:hypothetical protein
MAIQRTDEYIVFGQTNYALRRLTHIFKVSKELRDKDSVVGVPQK